MSAIAGIYYINKQAFAVEHGDRLMGALQRYPADDVQTWHKGYIYFGCHAQWITPESVGERLPYYDEKKQLAITADAIIDNRAELFEKLHVPHFQRNMSDSELILLAYDKWGKEAPKLLIGDYAFMIWDERRHLLFGARDYSGTRTLYFHRTSGRFAFCTTIEPLFTVPGVEKILNEQWLAEYLALPHMSESLDASSTVYKKVGQVPPSHTITVEGDKVSFSRYCVITDVEQLRLKSNEEYDEAFREVFQSAVTARLRTHRQVGAQLSGGLDSGSVVSFAAKDLLKLNKRLHTYSYVPPRDFVDWTPKSRMADERSYIQSTVQYVGNIKDHYLDFKEKSPLTEIDNLLETLEMPYKFFENSAWHAGICEKASEQGVGVLLCGDMGNFTISWGQAVEYYAALLKKLNWICLFRELNQYSQNKGIKKSLIFPVIAKTAFPFLNRFSRSKKPVQYPFLVNPALAKRTDVFNKLKEHGVRLKNDKRTVFELRKILLRDVFYYNHNGASAAKLSLRYSLWRRDPTNDERLVRFCLSVPEDQFVQNGLDRSLIRRATQNCLPDKVRLNHQVRGIQGVDWVHRMSPSWNTFVQELHQLSKDPVMSEFVDMQVVKTAISKVREGPRPEYALNPEYRILMRSLIIYRFLKKFA